MICRPHPPTAPLAFACPRCAGMISPYDMQVILPRFWYLACCCPHCEHHGPLLSFARAGVAA
jgi:hypothetical protein